MIRERCFDNPFPDYSPAEAKCILDNGKLKSDSKIITGLEDKWRNTVTQFKYLDYNDYSVYTGTSGIALLKFKQNPESKENLKDIRQLLSLHRLKRKRHTFLCGDAGPLALGAVVDYKLSDKNYSDHLEKLKSLEQDVIDTCSALPNEYLYGRAGYLFAILFANKYISPPPFDETFIKRVTDSIITCGRKEAQAGKFKCPLMYQWHDSFYLGAAHGLSGILYLLLQAKEYLTEANLFTLIKPTVDYLITLRFSSGNFPSSLGRDKDKYIQWCHGAPGFLYMFSMAYKVFGDSKYLQLAVECGDVIWDRGLLRKGYSLCHGVSGNAYCFLELYQTTQDEKHLYRAAKFAEWCFDYNRNHVEHPADRPFSLYEGVSGPMYLFLDIQTPMDAKFPGFTL